VNLSSQIKRGNREKRSLPTPKRKKRGHQRGLLGKREKKGVGSEEKKKKKAERRKRREGKKGEGIFSFNTPREMGGKREVVPGGAEPPSELSGGKRGGGGNWNGLPWTSF